MTLVAAGGDRPVNGTRRESLLGLDHHADRTVLSEYLPLRLYGPSAVSAVDRHTWVVVDLQKVAPGSSGDAMHRCTPLVFLLLASPTESRASRGGGVRREADTSRDTPRRGRVNRTG